MGDVKCIQDSTTQVLTKYSKGFAGINLINLDPIEIDKIDIVNGGQSPVNLKLYFKKAKLYGGKDAIIKKIT